MRHGAVIDQIDGATCLYERLGYQLWPSHVVVDHWEEGDDAGEIRHQRADECLYLTKELGVGGGRTTCDEVTGRAEVLWRRELCCTGATSVQNDGYALSRSSAENNQTFMDPSREAHHSRARESTSSARVQSRKQSIAACRSPTPSRQSRVGLAAGCAEIPRRDTG